MCMCVHVNWEAISGNLFYFHLVGSEIELRSSGLVSYPLSHLACPFPSPFKNFIVYINCNYHIFKYMLYKRIYNFVCVYVGISMTWC